MTDRSKFLGRMLERLYASLLSGAGLNCVAPTRAGSA